jgi:hypothetical protein
MLAGLALHRPSVPQLLMGLEFQQTDWPVHLHRGMNPKYLKAKED